MPKYTLLFLGRDQDLESQSNDEMRRMYASIGTWWEDLEKKGVIKEGAQLGPQRSATAVRRVNGKMTVREGPLFASDERVGGVALVEVTDLDAAIAIAKSWPAGDVEVRPIVEH